MKLHPKLKTALEILSLIFISPLILIGVIGLALMLVGVVALLLWVAFADSGYNKPYDEAVEHYYELLRKKNREHYDGLLAKKNG